MPMTPGEIKTICDLALRRSGIVLDAGKQYLIEARLGTLIKNQGISSISELILKLKQPNHAAVERDVVDCLTTNETSFFRDLHPFDAFKKTVVPDVLAQNAQSRTLSIWCAASSTGQEPYSLAILLRDAFPQLANWKITFIASDLSRDVLAKAKSGRYSQLEVNRGLPAAMLVKYFNKLGLEWEVKPEIRNMIDFKELNLLESWPIMPLFDIVFIRNVLIYFNNDTKKKILAKIRGVMRPSSYLFLGGAETTLNIDDNFDRVQVDKSGCYRLKSRVALAA